MPRKKSGSGPGTLVRKSTSVFLLALAIGVALAVWPTRARALNLCALAALRPKGAFSAYDSLEPIHFRQRVARVSGNPGEFKYHGHLRKMSRAIEGRFPAVQEVQRVLYPMSGTDASAPFQLFPNAELVIALDNHAAVGSYEDAVSIPIEYARTNSSLYRSYREIDESEPLPAILGSLWDGIPGFRLRGVNLFQTPWRALRFTHAEIVFDSGPGTRIRRYVHVQDVFYPNSQLQNRWWYQELESAPPQAVLAKASMGSLQESSSGECVELRRSIYRWLGRTSGFLVEGSLDGSLVGRSYGWELTYVSTNTNSDYFDINDVLFGYARKARVHKFRPTNQAPGGRLW